MVKKFYSMFNIKKSYFFKMNIFYTIFTILIIIISSILIVSYSNSVLKNQIYKTNAQLLNQVQIFADSNFIEKPNQLTFEKFFSIDRNNLFSDFFVANSSDSYAAYTVYQDVINMQAYSKFIYSVDLYRKKDGLLVSSKDVVLKTDTMVGRQMATTINFKLLENFNASDNIDEWYSITENSKLFPDKHILTLIRSIPINSPPKDRVGNVIINIDMDGFTDDLKSIIDTNNQEIFILNNDMEIMYNSSFRGLEQAEVDKIIIFLRDNKENKILEFKGKKVLLSYKKSVYQNWNYVSMIQIDVLNQQIVSVTFFVLIVLICVIFLTQFGVRKINAMLYKPVRELISNSEGNSLLEYSKNQDEFTYINNLITVLKDQVDDMEDIVDLNKGFIEYRICMDLINGNLYEKEKLLPQLEMIGKQFDGNYYALVLAEVDEVVLTLLPVKQREYIILKILSVVKHFFQDKYDCIGASYSYNGVITIINYNDYEPIEGYAQSILELLKEKIDVPYNLSIIDRCDNIIDIKKKYLDAKNYFKYSFICGNENIFTHDVIAGYEKNVGDFSITHFNEIGVMLRTRKTECVKEEIDKIFDDFKRKKYSYSYVQNTIMQIVNLICYTSAELNVEVDELDKNNVLIKFNKITSLDRCKEWIYLLLNILDENAERARYNIDNDYFANMISYISDNITNGITLSSMAEKYNISGSYLSKIFKEKHGSNFSVYLAEKKLEKACELLVGEKNYSISEIANMLGYSKSSYFNKIFKENYGITPIQYKKKNS